MHTKSLDCKQNCTISTESLPQDGKGCEPEWIQVGFILF